MGTAIRLICLVLFLALAGLPPAAQAASPDAAGWSDTELAAVRSLWIGSLPPLPPDPSDLVSDDPRAIAFGKQLFFDTGLSANGLISCGTCHRPSYVFTDDLPRGQGMGTTSRRTMPLIGAAYQSWFFWDGRKDSLWSQAIGPIESSVEHGMTRTLCAHIVRDRYREEYTALFGKLPHITHENCPPAATPLSDDPEARNAWEGMKPEDRDAVNRIYANIGKAIEAYVRRILPTPSRFDRYAKALLDGDREKAAGLYSGQEAAGLRLFIGRAGCINCHNGPLFTNSSFHSVGVPGDDRGRAEGIGKVLSDEFNCLGPYSDARPEQCMELRFIDRDSAKYEGAMKTPSLRSVADRPPYMNAGQFSTLREVLDFYQNESMGPSIKHQGLTDTDKEALEAFLKTLSSPLKAP